MSEVNETSELPSLLEALCNDELSSEQLERLQDLLRVDPAAQRTYLAYLDLHLGLKHVIATESGRKTVIEGRQIDDSATFSTQRQRPSTARRAVVATLFVFATVILVVLSVKPREKPAVQNTQIAATLTEVSGQVNVYQANGEVRSAKEGMDILSGERIETIEAGALAVVTYADDTRLTLVNSSSVTFVMDKRKSVALHQGIVSAQVAPQPTGQPMRLTTPGAKIEVLGTRFALAASTNRTELKVSEGRVRLTRESDGQVIEVARGQGVVTNDDETLTVRESAGAPDQWDVDFEHGRPQGWTGTWTKSELPPGSTGAIRAVDERGSAPVVYVIASPEEWVKGLFSLHADTHLHFTMKMTNPDWLNVFLSTRGGDPTKPSWALLNFNEVPFWPPKPGQWRTVTIPLTEFRRKRNGVFRHEPFIDGEVAYSLSISATEPDRGLVIDRIWVTRGGSGQVEAKILP